MFIVLLPARCFLALCRQIQLVRNFSRPSQHLKYSKQENSKDARTDQTWQMITVNTRVLWICKKNCCKLGQSPTIFIDILTVLLS